MHPFKADMYSSSDFYDPLVFMFIFLTLSWVYGTFYKMFIYMLEATCGGSLRIINLKIYSSVCCADSEWVIKRGEKINHLPEWVKEK